MNWNQIRGDPKTSRGQWRGVHNSKALAGLAAHLDQLFQLPLPYSPGANFMGAMVRLEAFGLQGHPDAGAAGRGITPEQALESCLGEAAEYLSFLERDDDPLLVTGPISNALSEEAMAWALAGAGFPVDQNLIELDWIEAARVDGSGSAQFPSELVLRRPTERRAGARQAETNGLGAGIDYEQAVMSGIMEVIERDAFALWWFGGNPGIRIQPDQLPGGDFSAFATKVRQGAKRPYWLLNITTDIGIPAVASLSSFPDGTAVIAGFAANPDPCRAAENAFLEMCQMELAQQLSLLKRKQQGLDGLTDLDCTWIDRFERFSSTSMPQVLGADDRAMKVFAAVTGSTLDTCVEILTTAGFTPYVVDLMRQEIGIPVVKVLVPGLQSAKPDWITSRLRAVAAQNGVSLDQIKNKLSPI